MYLKLLLDPYFQVSALEAILAWWVLYLGVRSVYLMFHRLRDETARVDDVLAQPEPTQAILNAFVMAKANSFENLVSEYPSYLDHRHDRCRPL